MGSLTEGRIIQSISISTSCIRKCSLSILLFIKACVTAVKRAVKFEFVVFNCYCYHSIFLSLSCGFVSTLYILTNDNQSTKYRTLCYPIYALTSLRRLVVRRFEFVDVFPNTVKSRLGLTSQIDCIAESCRKIGTFTPYPLTSILRTQRVLCQAREHFIPTPKSSAYRVHSKYRRSN